MEDLPLLGQCRYRSASAAAPTSRFRTSRWCLPISRPAHPRQQIISDRSRSTASFGFPGKLNRVTKISNEADVRARPVSSPEIPPLNSLHCWIDEPSKNREEENPMIFKTMTSKTLRIARMIVLAAFALSSAAWAATCSNASLSGTYGFLHAGIDSHGAPAAAVTQLTFDSTTGTYIGEDLENIDGVIIPSSLTATYAVAKNCTVTAQVKLVSGGHSEN